MKTSKRCWTKTGIRLNDKADTFFLQMTKKTHSYFYEMYAFTDKCCQAYEFDSFNCVLVFFIQSVFLLSAFNLTLCSQFIAYNPISDTKMSENGQ